LSLDFLFVDVAAAAFEILWAEWAGCCVMGVSLIPYHSGNYLCDGLFSLIVNGSEMG